MENNGLADLVEKQNQDWYARFETEPYVLDLIYQKSDIPVPECVARDTSKSTIPEYYHILRKMKGYAPAESSSKPAFRNLGENKKKRILHQVGENISKLHQIQFEDFGEVRVENEKLTVEKVDGWSKLFRNMILFWIDQVEGGQFDELVSEITEAVGNNLNLIEDVETPVLVHREVDTKNILVEDGELAAILDWEACVAGHGEFDLVTTEGRMIAHSFSTDSVWEKYRRELYKGYENVRELEDGWEERRWLYLLYPMVLEMAFHSEKSPNTEEVIKNRTREILDNLHSRN
ncbi:MAG: phosphotransferase [Nanohaloarchaea archaeon]|nr:phosphotransferase [Candidatus Nanohaloarchaea archaeon]